VDKLLVYHLRFAINIRQLEEMDIETEIWQVLRGLGEMRIDKREFADVDPDSAYWLEAIEENDNGES